MKKIGYSLFAIILIATFLIGVVLFDLKHDKTDKEVVLQEGAYEQKQAESQSRVVSIEEQNSYWVYDNWDDFMNEREMPYADEATFNVIKAAYSKIDFIGEIKADNTAAGGEHVEAFLKMLDNENSEYYYFDVDEDKYDLPELAVRNSSGEIYVYKYQPETKQCVLWSKLESYWYSLIGSRKVLWTGNGGQYASFYQLSANGETEYETFFGYRRFNENESFYLVGMPIYAKMQNEEIVTEYMKTQGAYLSGSGNWCFRITEEQYNEIADEYWEAYLGAQEEIKEVTYSYDELLEKLISLRNCSNSSLLMDKEAQADSFSLVHDGFYTGVEISLEDCACEYDNNGTQVYSYYVNNLEDVEGYALYIRNNEYTSTIFPVKEYLIDSEDEKLYMVWGIHSFERIQGIDFLENLNGFKIQSISSMERLISEAYELEFLDDGTDFTDLQVELTGISEEENRYLCGKATAVYRRTGECYTIEWRIDTVTFTESAKHRGFF